MESNPHVRAWSYSLHEVWQISFILSTIMLSTFKSTISDLTLVIQALKQFQGFSKSFKGCAIALYSSELAWQHGWQRSTAELHLYAIAQERTQGFAHPVGLGGEG